MCKQEVGSLSEKVKTADFVADLWNRFGAQKTSSEGQNTENQKEESEKEYKEREKEVIEIDPETNLWLYGRKRGWLEEQDQLWAKIPIEKRSAARIIHEFLRIEYQIPEERDWKQAEKLEDLYHCRACAKHVAQVYLRGLMQAKTEKRFGLLDKLTEEEVNQIFDRICAMIHF